MKINIEEVKKRIFDVHGDIISIKEETYKATNVKAVFIDKDYGEWTAEPNKIFRGAKHKLRSFQDRKIAKPGNSLQDCYPEISLEWDFDKNDLLPKNVNKSSAEKFWFRCLRDKSHSSYYVSLANKVRRPGCPECRRLEFVTKMKTASYEDSLGSKYPQLILEWVDSTSIFSVYPSSNDFFKFKCLKTGKEYFACANDKTSGNGCPCCRFEKMSETRRVAKNGNSFAERFPFLLPEWADSADPHSVNFGSADKYLFKCLKNANHGTYECSLFNKIKPRGCPKCGHVYTKPEIFYEEKLGIKKYNKRFYINDELYYMPDFKLKENLFLESLGHYWHSSKRKEDKYHFYKRKHFSDAGARLLQFYDAETYNKWPIIESIINNARGNISNKIMARKCEIKNVTPKERQSFFEQNHLMGDYKASTAIGLYQNNTLVSCISYSVNQDMIKIQRFSTILNTVVAGGFQRLLSCVEKIARMNDIKKIVSFCDLRYATGNSYEKAGFNLVKISLGWKWADSYNLFNRLKCKAGNGKTEAENALEKRWFKVYDAVQAKYEKNL